jgi:hypothetical protein
MDSEYVIILFVIVIFAIIVSNYYFDKKQIVRRKLKKAIARKMSDIQSGEIAKISGEVEIIGKPLIAPLSKRECAYYYVLIERLVSRGNGSNWETLIEEEKAGTFLIKDGKNFAHVNGTNIKAYIVEDRMYKSGFLNDPNEILEKYLNDHGQEFYGLLGFNKTLRYKEGVLERGETIAVIGKGEWVSAGYEKLPKVYGQILSITSTNNKPVYLSDDPETVLSTN